MTVFPSPSLASESSVSIDTPSILLMAVRAGMYFLVPNRTSMNSSVEICPGQREVHHDTQPLGMKGDVRLRES